MKLLRLNEILKEKGLHSRELAEKVDVSPNTISRIANGSSFPSADLLSRIAETLEMSVKDLFYPGENEEPIYIKRNEQFIKIGDISKL